MHLSYYSKACLKPPLKKYTKIGFQYQLSLPLMQVKSIAECSNRSILQYFLPSLSYHFPLRPLFSLLNSGRGTLVSPRNLVLGTTLHIVNLSFSAVTVPGLLTRGFKGQETGRD